MSTALVIGSFVQDLAFSTDDFPTSGQTVIGNFFAGPGGKGFNQAVACHRQGVDTTFIGSVGTDIFAEAVKQFSNSEKLKIILQEHTNLSTGTAGIIVNKKSENMIIVSLGANDALSHSFIEKNRNLIEKCSVLLLQVEANLDAIKRSIALAKQSKSVTTILNPAPINPRLTLEMLHDADIITPNETELEFIAKKILGYQSFNLENLSDQDLCDILQRISHPNVIVTLGAAGSFVYSPTKGIKKRVIAIDVEPLDTTGAGDAFNGGLAAGLVKFKGDLLKSVEYANIVAGLSTTKLGTAPSMPSALDVEKFQLAR